MSKGPKLPLEQVEPIAQDLKRQMSESCKKTEIAGSIRRREDLVGDIELLCLTEPLYQASFLDKPAEQSSTRLDDLIVHITRTGTPWMIGQINGSRHKQIIQFEERVRADIFIITDDRAWGSNLLVRTGPWEFSRSLMARAHRLGKQFSDGFLLHNHRGRCEEGADCPDVVPLESERAVFDALDMTFVPPEQRSRNRPAKQEASDS